MDKGRAPSQDQVDKFNYLSPMLDSALKEMREFSKRKQDGIVSAAKIKILNRILSDVRTIVSEEDTVNYLDLLDEQDLPQNSDAVFMLTQYLQCFEKLRSDNVVNDYRGWCWRILDRKHPDADDDGYVFIPTVERKRIW